MSRNDFCKNWFDALLAKALTVSLHYFNDICLLKNIVMVIG